MTCHTLTGNIVLNGVDDDQYNIFFGNIKISSLYHLPLCDSFISNYHCVKSVRIRSFSGPYFPVFGLNPEISLRIQSEYWKIPTRKTLNTDTFHAVIVTDETIAQW